MTNRILVSLAVQKSLTNPWHLITTDAVNNTVTIRDEIDEESQSTYTFNRVFSPESSQQAVYESVVKPILPDLLFGVNACVVAYGDRGTGKTNTLRGNEESIGILPRVMHELFLLLEQSDSADINVEVSYMSIYNEVVEDLLNGGRTNLKVREIPNHETVVVDLTRHQVNNADDVLNLLKQGYETSCIQCTTSGRTLSLYNNVIHVYIQRTERTSGVTYLSKFTACDVTTYQLENSARRNVTASSFQNVLESLAKRRQGQVGFIPWRNSQLTRILRDSLDEKSNVSLIIHINTDSKFARACVDAVKFGHEVADIPANKVKSC